MQHLQTCKCILSIAGRLLSLHSLLATPCKSPSNLVCALQSDTTPIIEDPQANLPLLRSGVDPLVSVNPNATDVFYVAAAALMGVISNGCGVSQPLHMEMYAFPASSIFLLCFSVKIPCCELLPRCTAEGSYCS